MKKVGRIHHGGGWHTHGRGNHHAKTIERYNRILAEEFLYARTWSSEQQRAQALHVRNTHYNYHQPHTATRNQPPDSRPHTHVTNLQTSYNKS